MSIRQVLQGKKHVLVYFGGFWHIYWGSDLWIITGAIPTSKRTFVVAFKVPHHEQESHTNKHLNNYSFEFTPIETSAGGTLLCIANHPAII